MGAPALNMPVLKPQPVFLKPTSKPSWMSELPMATLLPNKPEFMEPVLWRPVTPIKGRTVPPELSKPVLKPPTPELKMPVLAKPELKLTGVGQVGLGPGLFNSGVGNVGFGPRPTFAAPNAPTRSRDPRGPRDPRRSHAEMANQQTCLSVIIDAQTSIAIAIVSVSIFRELSAQWPISQSGLHPPQFTTHRIAC